MNSHLSDILKVGWWQRERGWISHGLTCGLQQKKKKKCTVKYGYWFCMDTSSPWPESNHTHRFIWIVPSLSEQGVHDASSSCGDKSILITNCPYSLRTQGYFLPNWLLSQKPAELEDCNQPDKSNKSCVYGVFLSFFVKTSHLKHLCQWQSTRQFFFFVLFFLHQLCFNCDIVIPLWVFACLRNVMKSH